MVNMLELIKMMALHWMMDLIYVVEMFDQEENMDRYHELIFVV
jgi:hypothetical protein